MPIQLINIHTVDSTIVLDIRYATCHNFLNLAVYPQAVCYVHQTVAKHLKAVQNELKAFNLSLKIFDGYRPLSIQQIMWDKVQDEKFVSNPAKNKGRHTRGTAVDVTLVNHLGEDLEMPSNFDEFSERAHSCFQKGSKQALANRELLKTIMERHHLQQLATEWWHFDLIGWEDDHQYPPLNLSFSELEKQI